MIDIDKYPINCGLVELRDKLIVLNKKDMTWVALSKRYALTVEQILKGYI